MRNAIATVAGIVMLAGGGVLLSAGPATAQPSTAQCPPESVSLSTPTTAVVLNHGNDWGSAHLTTRAHLIEMVSKTIPTGTENAHLTVQPGIKYP